jgi:hypothetical protein
LAHYWEAVWLAGLFAFCTSSMLRKKMRWILE